MYAIIPIAFCIVFLFNLAHNKTIKLEHHNKCVYHACALHYMLRISGNSLKSFPVYPRLPFFIMK